MRRLRLGAFVPAVAILAIGCQGATSPAPTTSSPPASPGGGPTAAPPSPGGGDVDLFGTAYAPDEGVDGGQIIVADWQEANQFNPYYIAQVTEANVASAAWATLVVLTHDYKFAPDLAAEIPTLDNGGVAVPGEGGDAMTVTWQLKDGLEWSDGEPLTCDDFRFAWQWVLDEDNTGLVTSGWEDVTDWECPSDTEMVIHFDAIYEGYITLVTAPLPRHYLEDIPVADVVNGAGFRAEEVANLPVSGAFKFESVTPGQELRLIRNDRYRSFSTGKPAHLDTLIFKWYGDADAMIAGYRGGEVDFATDLQDSDLPKVQDLGDQVSAIPSLTYEFLRPNWSAFDDFDEETQAGGCSRNPAVVDRGDGCPMADPAMRQALSFAIDKNAINSRLLGNTVQVANSNITPDVWFFADQPPATYDPARARQILEDAGWTDPDGDGVREKDGVKAKIELCTTTRQVRQDTLALIAGWLKDVGIESVVNAVDPASIFATYNESNRDTPCALSHSNFDLAEHAFTSSIDPLGNYFTYHSSQFNPASNNASVSNPEIDAALEKVLTSVDFAEIRDAMVEFQRVFIEQAVEVPLYYRKLVELHDAKLGNFFANPTQAGPTWNAVDWYVRG
jgi:peptide/nickel transport system substrate-binding protein